MWILHFDHDFFFPLKGETRFFCIFEKTHFENDFGVTIFLRENKIRKKTLNVTPNRKSKFVKTESRFRGQVTYWKDTVGSRSTS